MQIPEIPEDAAAQWNKSMRDHLLKTNGPDAMDQFEKDVEGCADAIDFLVDMSYEGLKQGLSPAAVLNGVSMPISSIRETLPVILAGYIVHIATERIIEEMMSDEIPGSETE